MKKISMYVIGAVLLAGLVGGSAVAFASQDDFSQRGFQGDNFGEAFQRGPAGEGQGGPEGHRGPRQGRDLGGEVTAIGDNSLTLETRNGDSVTVNTTDDTKVMLAETQSEGSLGDIQVGSHVMVRGQRNDDGSVDAKGIMVAPEGDHVGGKVTSVDGNTITVENREGETASIVTSDTTEIRLGKDETGSLADISEDNVVRAFGELQDDGSLNARLIFAGQPGEGRGPGHGGPRQGRGLGGEVTAIGDNSLTLETRNGDSVTVNTTDDTKVMLAETQSEGSLGDIQVGSHVMVRGQRNDDGSVDAKGIMVAPEGDPAGGKVTSVNGETIVVENREGESTNIVTSSDTTFRNGRDAGSLADISAGDMVRAFGEQQDDGSLNARLVFSGMPGKGPGPKNNGN